MGTWSGRGSASVAVWSASRRRSTCPVHRPTSLDLSKGHLRLADYKSPVTGTVGGATTEAHLQSFPDLLWLQLQRFMIADDGRSFTKLQVPAFPASCHKRGPS